MWNIEMIEATEKFWEAVAANAASVLALLAIAKKWNGWGLSG